MTPRDRRLLQHRHIVPGVVDGLAAAEGPAVLADDPSRWRAERIRALSELSIGALRQALVWAAAPGERTGRPSFLKTPR